MNTFFLAGFSIFLLTYFLIYLYESTKNRQINKNFKIIAVIGIIVFSILLVGEGVVKAYNFAVH